MATTTAFVLVQTIIAPSTFYILPTAVPQQTYNISPT